ncbi:maestro heat-like repeat-containing protein family member 1 [Zonotrichia albicollis]|uniref:maestro heat-like repeat-containing protein family member 1 n=1 Tax=Zonotrichia albicollis TaxID=44394 RepID=UPI003D8103CF
MEAQKVSILSALKVPLQDGSPKVRGALVQLISALAHRGFLQQQQQQQQQQQHPGAEALLQFLLQQCDLPDEPPPGMAEEIPEDPSSDDVRSVSVSTLSCSAPPCPTWHRCSPLSSGSDRPAPVHFEPSVSVPAPLRPRPAAAAGAADPPRPGPALGEPDPRAAADAARWG